MLKKSLTKQTLGFKIGFTVFLRDQFDMCASDNRYEKRIEKLKNQELSTANIEKTIQKTMESLKKSKSFIIYGEPQSGKTEMMIALTAKLLDKGHKIIIILLNDSISLLNQNLERFSRSGLSPTPKNFTEILKPEIEIGDKKWVIFSKKNSKDLTRLKDKLKNKNPFIIIDDEADYATPNSKINKREKSKINELIKGFLERDGIYIGVTATPARLDLNNTFENNKNMWVCFDPHHSYKGHKIFFPIQKEPLNRLIKGSGDFKLELMPETEDNPKFLRKALFSFLINVSYLNKISNKDLDETSYSFLIHTSGKKSDHEKDEKIIISIFNTLTETNNSEKKNKYYKEISQMAQNRFPEEEMQITQYIKNNADRYRVVVMNSDQEKNFRNNKMATNPITLFTIIIGGNIVSRGVTFEKLLSMFFTRGVKHKMQQDTYIQRARMFGSRKEYLKYFELTIPENLYIDWHRCFLFHTLALKAIESGHGAPVWIESRGTRPVATASIDKAKLEFNAGEMRFAVFTYHKDIENIIDTQTEPLKKLNQIRNLIGDKALPEYLINFIQNYSQNPHEILIHPSSSIENWKDADQETIDRRKGFIGRGDMQKDKYPHAKHHIKIYFSNEKARLCYKHVSPERIKFLSVSG